MTVYAAWSLLGAVLCLSACAPAAGGSASVVFASPRSTGASTDVQGQEAIADAVESVDQLLQSGRAAYASDPGRRSAVEYCRAGEDEIERGALRQAVRDKSKALYVAGQNRDPLLSAECARSIAIAYSFAGEQTRAVDWANEAERYLQQAGPGVDAARAAGVQGPLLKVRADAALDRGDLAQARSLLTTARSVGPGYYRPYVLVSLAQIDLAQGNFPAADAELDAALELPGVPDELNAIIVRTKGDVAFGRGDLPGAAALFNYGARLSTQSGDTYGDAWAERGLARVQIARGQPAQAILSYARAMQAAEQSRTVFRADELRSGAFGRLQTIFDEAVGTLAQQGRWQDAFDASERGRARSLRDLLRNQPGAAPARAARAQDVEAALPAGTALVSYHMLNDRLLIWTVRRSGISGVSVALSAKDLEAQVRSFTTLVSRPGQDRTLDPVAQSLFARLIQPAGLQADERIVFVPYGILHNLAFAALKNGEKNGGRWLVEDHAMSEVLTAGSIIGSTAGRFPDGHDILVFADPDGSLPAADKEAAAIAGLIPGVSVMAGAQASKDRFVTAAPRATVVHVAAHAEFDPLDPLSSRIRLAGKTGETGDLQAQEVYGLQLGHVDMLVLSACETSIGSPSPGDEVIGFNRSFLTAGVRNLVSTLWSVNDQATALLMAVFYKTISTSPQPASLPDGLRAAQLFLLHDPVTASPFYWGAFTLTQSSGRGTT